ncbi:hypothetical protein Q757_03880 [Oenococcus alcoholitolerans]|uniref:Acyltransferase 3 domain-containing protein n=1 Tax=Oenococcus alcoholitolerans TaxID=931074 RepID=A0ABR4XR71_9LACO|nr:hypothetical protein Q757_03880 [Oenococcus alcoholitolerans]
MEKKKISENKSFIKGLEGLRAISVLGVILFHLWPNIFAGGFSGVTVFFVISGFLMTRIILKGFKNGTFSFWDFYKRRFWRPYPAFFIMLLSATGIVSLFFPDALFGIRGNFFSNIFMSITGIKLFILFLISQQATTGKFSPICGLSRLKLSFTYYGRCFYSLSLN